MLRPEIAYSLGKHPIFQIIVKCHWWWVVLFLSDCRVVVFSPMDVRRIFIPFSAVVGIGEMLWRVIFMLLKI